MSFQTSKPEFSRTVTLSPAGSALSYDFAPSLIDWEAICVGGRLYLFGYSQALDREASAKAGLKPAGDGGLV